MTTSDVTISAVARWVRYIIGDENITPKEAISLTALVSAISPREFWAGYGLSGVDGVTSIVFAMAAVMKFVTRMVNDKDWTIVSVINFASSVNTVRGLAILASIVNADDKDADQSLSELETWMETQHLPKVSQTPETLKVVPVMGEWDVFYISESRWSGLPVGSVEPGREVRGISGIVYDMDNVAVSTGDDEYIVIPHSLAYGERVDKSDIASLTKRFANGDSEKMLVAPAYYADTRSPVSLAAIESFHRADKRDPSLSPNVVALPAYVVVLGGGSGSDPGTLMSFSQACSAGAIICENITALASYPFGKYELYSHHHSIPPWAIKLQGD